MYKNGQFWDNFRCSVEATLELSDFLTVDYEHLPTHFEGDVTPTKVIFIPKLNVAYFWKGTPEMSSSGAWWTGEQAEVLGSIESILPPGIYDLSDKAEREHILTVFSAQSNL